MLTACVTIGGLSVILGIIYPALTMAAFCVYRILGGGMSFWEFMREV